MTVSALSAARHLAEYSGWSLSNLKLQKILYIAHMRHLGRTGEPLLTGNFEAWDYGPVHRDLYQAVRVFGADPVQDVFHGAARLPEDSTEREIIESSYDRLKNVSAGGLVNATHKKHGAWYSNYKPGVRGIVIPNSDVLREYRSLAAA